MVRGGLGVLVPHLTFLLFGLIPKLRTTEVGHYLAPKDEQVLDWFDGFELLKEFDLQISVAE